MSRNVFEGNEAVPDSEDVEAVGDDPHVMLPPLSEGFRYEFQKLPSGRTAVVIKGEVEIPPGHTKTHAKYRPCEFCGGSHPIEDLDSPESRELRHRD